MHLHFVLVNGLPCRCAMSLALIGVLLLWPARQRVQAKCGPIQSVIDSASAHRSEWSVAMWSLSISRYQKKPTKWE